MLAGYTAYGHFTLGNSINQEQFHYVVQFSGWGIDNIDTCTVFFTKDAEDI